MKINVIQNLGFSPTGKYLACGSADKFLRTYLLYNNEDGKSIQPELEFEQELDDEVNFTIFSPEGDLVTALTNKSVNVFRRRKKELLYRFETSGIVPKRATFCLQVIDNILLASILLKDIYIQSIAREEETHIFQSGM